MWPLAIIWPSCAKFGDMVNDGKPDQELYPSLPPSNYIRLLSYDRSIPGRPRQYHLFARPIEDGEPYLALSYRWREDQAKQPIIVNGKPVTIMRTVKDFLDLHLKKRQLIFIDSICINQRDLEERASQVRLMGKVYSRAEKVCVWLGTDLSVKDRWNLHLVTSGKASLPRCLDLCRRLFYKDYWQRSWVIQELTLPRTIEILWGSMVLTEGALMIIAKCGLPQPNQVHVTQATVVLRREQRREQPHRTWRLMELLAAYDYAQAKDTRDKVYALLGMADDVTDRRKFPIDYSDKKTPADLFCDVMSFCGVPYPEYMAFPRKLGASFGLVKSDFLVMPRALYQFVYVCGWPMGVVRDSGEELTELDRKLHKEVLDKLPKPELYSATEEQTAQNLLDDAESSGSDSRPSDAQIVAVVKHASQRHVLIENPGSLTAANRADYHLLPSHSPKSRYYTHATI